MKKLFLSLVVLMIAGLQTVSAQGFRVYKSDGTVAQFSLRTDSIVFYDGIGSDSDFGPFTPVNQCIAKTWYMSKSETVTFNEDGTTDYMEGATYEFMPYQGSIIIYNASGVPVNLFQVHKVTDDKMIVNALGEHKLKVWATTPLPQPVEKIELSETSLTLQTEETETLIAYVYPNDAANIDLTWESSNNAVATIDASGLVTAVAEGTCTITCRATDGSGVYAECAVTVEATSTINGHDYVEIGGLKWATMNVGATTVAGDYATCYGDYFAWGETEPRYSSITRTSANDAIFTWKDDYASGHSSDKFPTYRGNTLDAEHDVATVAWGSSWRTPTSEEFKALYDACAGNGDFQELLTLSGEVTEGGIYWLSAEQIIEPLYTGVDGVLFVCKSDISKRIFFPACGLIDGTTFYRFIDNDGIYASYWSSSLKPSAGLAAYYLTLNFSVSESWSSFASLYYSCNTYYGYAVRPVSD